MPDQGSEFVAAFVKKAGGEGKVGRPSRAAASERIRRSHLIAAEQLVHPVPVGAKQPLDLVLRVS